MSDDESCWYPNSERGSASNFDRDPLIKHGYVAILMFFVLVANSLPVWTNDFVWANNDSFSTNISGSSSDNMKTVFIELPAFPEYRTLVLVSAVVSFLLLLWALGQSDTEFSDGVGLRDGIQVGMIYVGIIIFVEAFLIQNSSSFVGTFLFSVIQFTLLFLFLRRVTTPILPNIRNSERWEPYRRNVRHSDRLVLSFGIGVVVSLVIAILPTNSSVGSLLTIILLAGPLMINLIGIIITGKLKQNRAIEAEFSQDDG